MSPGNPEARRLALAGLLAGLCLAALAALGLFIFWSSFTRTVVDRDVALVGRLLAASPGAEQRIMQSLVRAPSPEEIAAGRETARRYGYDGELPAQLIPALRGSFILSIASTFGLLSVGILAAGLLVRRGFSRLYAALRQISNAAEMIAEGNPGLRLHESGEGELSLLNHRVNQMAERLLAALEQLHGEKEYLKDFITDVSHQLKTPLSSVRMFTELLLEGVQEEKRTEFLSRSRSQIDRMEWLIASLLAVARMEAGAVELPVASADLQRTVTEALAGLRELWQRKGISLQWQPPAPVVMVPHDPRWLGEALSNIVKNCIEHTPKGGTVVVTLEHSAVLARLTISDNGEGINEEDLPRIFDRFYKAGGAPGAGTGVGLALARAIVERHHGVISVTSAPAAGTRFVVTLHTRDI